MLADEATAEELDDGFVKVHDLRANIGLRCRAGTLRILFPQSGGCPPLLRIPEK
jgi:hypothetical protein